MANELGYMPEENGYILNEYGFHVGRTQLYGTLSLIATMFTWQPVRNTTCVIKQHLNCKSYLTFSYCVINSPTINYGIMQIHAILIFRLQLKTY